MTDIHDRTAFKGTTVVTGASAGIGKVYADRLAKRGYDLILVARRENLLDTFAASLRGAHGIKIQTIIADLSKPQELDRAANAIAADENVTMLVNNAGASTLTSVGQTAVAAANAMTDINITALVRLTLAVLPGFKERDHGAIINIGSILGFHPLPVSTIYSGTKGYVPQLYPRSSSRSGGHRHHCTVGSPRRHGN